MLDIVALPILFALYMIHYELKTMNNREAAFCDEMKQRFRDLDARNTQPHGALDER